MFAACAARAVPRKTAAGRGFSSGEGPLVGGALKNFAPPPGRTASPEVSIQNVGRTPAKPAFTGGNKKNARKRYSGTAPARLRATKHSGGYLFRPK